jgi:TetR/AcrR family transcriptional regulator, transcriptional repressor for nem operon
MTRKGRATRERIIDAAADLIYERGVAAVTLDDVREATDTSKSQLYHYFAGKNDLVLAVIERQRERVLAFHTPHLEAPSTWDEIQRWRDAIVVAQAERQCRSGCPLGSLANELSELDQTARNQVSGAFATWQRLLAEGLAGMITSGALRSDADPAHLALSTIASLQGGLLLAEVERDTRPLEIALDAAITHLKSFASQPRERNGDKHDRKARTARPGRGQAR